MPKHYSSLPSRLLTPHQNEWVFKALRKNCTALVTSVAVLFSYKHSRWVKHQFGVLCIERNDVIKKYFLRFYNLEDMSLLIQQKIRKFIGTPFSVMRHLFFQMVINGRTIAFEFIDTLAGSEEFCLVTKALRGNLKTLKNEAEARYYENHPEEQKESRFRRLFRRKNKESKSKLSPSSKSPPTESSQMQHGKSDVADLTPDALIKNILNIMGIEAEKAMKHKDSRQEVEQLIAKYGGMACVRQITVTQFGSRLDETVSFPASPTQTSVTSPASTTQTSVTSPASITQTSVTSPASTTQTSVTSPASPTFTLSSMPKTPVKLALDTIAAFKPEKQVQITKKDAACKSPTKLLEDEEEFVASEVTQDSPWIDTSAETSKLSTSTGTPEKVAEPERPILPEAFFLELNMMSQKMQEKLIKREAEEKMQREQESAKKPKKGQPEQTAERENSKEIFASSTPKKSPVKPALTTLVNEAQKTPGEGNQTAYMTCVSDSTDETDSDSDEETK